MKTETTIEKSSIIPQIAIETGETPSTPEVVPGVKIVGEKKADKRSGSKKVVAADGSVSYGTRTLKDGTIIEKKKPGRKPKAE